MHVIYCLRYRAQCHLHLASTPPERFTCDLTYTSSVFCTLSLITLSEQFVRRTKHLLEAVTHFLPLSGRCSPASPKTAPAGPNRLLNSTSFPAPRSAPANGSAPLGCGSRRAHRPDGKPRPHNGNKRAALHVPNPAYNVPVPPTSATQGHALELAISLLH
ncbi:hypothetical protein GJAV_G00009610 [Gymnothorax javanicus]|nr:hypothetical protein GJAV_G00009610 [Gymnothorax javanicus]